MNIHEHQAKEILKKYGVSVPNGVMGFSVDDIIESGHKTGVDFIILTDHDTLQARLDGKQGYHSDILLIVGEEVNTSSGHLLSLGVGYHVQQKGPLGLP